MNLDQIQIIIIGGLNTDIIGVDIDEIIGKGELTLGGKLVIGPGGKSRNIAQMIAAYIGKGKVAMIGKTSKDPFNLWEVPLNSLKNAGVNTDFVSILNYENTKKYPGVALIPVNKQGENQIYVLPGINDDFSEEDIDKAGSLFDIVKNNKGIFTLSLELPLSTAIYGIKKTSESGIKVILDPGGINKDTDYTELLKQDIFMIKPNEHEAKILTGVEVNDFETAKKSAQHFFNQGIKNILITHGKYGAYLITGKEETHILIPDIPKSDQVDETGCGDQVTAVLCAEIALGKNILDASKTAILAGTLQFNRVGIQPISRKELENVKSK